MISLTNFLYAFIFSFVGSIPPGSINLSVIEMGLEQKIKAAMRFSLAASLMEYPYAWLAVKFEQLITSSPLINENLHLISAIVMTLLGVIGLWPTSQAPSKFRQKYKNSGFRRGLLLGVLNPLAIPYWVGITAYLRSSNWIEVNSPAELHAYLFGVFLGALMLLIVLAQLSNKVMQGFMQFPWIRKIPGTLLLVLGFYAFVQYFFFL